MNIAQALAQGITKLKHPSWKHGHIELEQRRDGTIEVYGRDNKGNPRWKEDSRHYQAHDGYEPHEPL